MGIRVDQLVAVELILLIGSHRLQIVAHWENMKYKSALPLIRTGDLLACKGTWLVSRGIRMVTGSEISHVGVACWLHFNGVKRLCMFEAMEGRDVRIVPVYKTLRHDYWDKGGKMYWKALDPVYQGDEIMSFCLEHWNEAYANYYQFLIILSPILRKLRALLGKSMDTDLNRYHCSELIATALREQGYDLSKNPALVTPGDLYTFDCYNPTGVLLEYSGRTELPDTGY